MAACCQTSPIPVRADDARDRARALLYTRFVRNHLAAWRGVLALPRSGSCPLRSALLDMHAYTRVILLLSIKIVTRIRSAVQARLGVLVSSKVSSAPGSGAGQDQVRAQARTGCMTVTAPRIDPAMNKTWVTAFQPLDTSVARALSDRISMGTAGTCRQPRCHPSTPS